MNTHATITIDIVSVPGLSISFLPFNIMHSCTLTGTRPPEHPRDPARASPRHPLPPSIRYHQIADVRSPRRHHGALAYLYPFRFRGPLLKKSNVQPGVADLNIQRLVEEKVNAFWKGLESVALKRGEVQFFFRLSGWNRGPDLVGWSKISVTLSKKDQRKAWLGMTTYEVRRVVHPQLKLTPLLSDYRKKLHGSNGTLRRRRRRPVSPNPCHT